MDLTLIIVAAAGLALQVIVLILMLWAIHQIGQHDDDLGDIRDAGLLTQDSAQRLIALSIDRAIERARTQRPRAFDSLVAGHVPFFQDPFTTANPGMFVPGDPPADEPPTRALDLPSDPTEALPTSI